MGDLTADVQLFHSGTVDFIHVPVLAADTYYKGALVFWDATSGLATTDGIADDDIFIGICAKQQVIAAASDLVEVAISGIWEFLNSNAAIAESGEIVFHDNSADSNSPADLDTATGITEESGEDNMVGTMIWTDGTTMRLWLNHFVTDAA